MNMSKISSNMKISMQVGVSNSQRYINLTKIYNNLGPNFCAALPALHAFTGCDFNSLFFRKGKKRPFDLLERSPKYVEAFKKLSNIEAINDLQELFPDFEEFVCRIY